MDIHSTLLNEVMDIPVDTPTEIFCLDPERFNDFCNTMKKIFCEYDIITLNTPGRPKVWDDVYEWGITGDEED